MMSYCYCVTHGIAEPCPRTISMQFPDQVPPCEPAPNYPCGHQPGTHSPSKPEQASNKFDVVGYLSDARFSGQKFFSVFAGVLPSDPLLFFYRYNAGEVTGHYPLKSVAGTPIPPWHYYLTPTDSPPWTCETHYQCTTITDVAVTVAGLQELSEPATSRDYTTGATTPWPYVRCGKTPCDINVDNPYNWQHHPTVHWGEPEFEWGLLTVAFNWRSACGTNLMIDDVSLPLGGLLDVDADWRPTQKTDTSKGHKNHRYGVNADLSGASVPLAAGGGPGPCGPRPSHGTTDTTWKRTALWTKRDFILKDSGIRAAGNDPGHLMPEHK